ncbi:unnamed protein product [Cuscuta campestris]|uniref:CCHC-type domain-containing protein n=1 Tax=Cuscuta campestris TaxID=132261 RepID=A0A484N9W1_9ASTE|nr:unnamed protein product [Cuscuta campestris]
MVCNRYIHPVPKELLCSVVLQSFEGDVSVRWLRLLKHRRVRHLLQKLSHESRHDVLGRVPEVLIISRVQWHIGLPSILLSYEARHLRLSIVVVVTQILLSSPKKIKLTQLDDKMRLSSHQKNTKASKAKMEKIQEKKATETFAKRKGNQMIKDAECRKVDLKHIINSAFFNLKYQGKAHYVQLRKVHPRWIDVKDKQVEGGYFVMRMMYDIMVRATLPCIDKSFGNDASPFQRKDIHEIRSMFCAHLNSKYNELIQYTLEDIRSVWRSIEVGWLAPTMTNTDGELIQKPYERFSKKEKDAAESNDQALNAIFGAVNRNQFRLISNCTEAKRAWDILLITHEGTTTVKTAKLQIVMSKIENLKMEDTESITNFHGRVRELANEAERLGEPITEHKLVLKVLRSLPEKYSMDVKAIRQTQSLNIMSLDELMGNLETIELEMHEDLWRKKQHVILVEKEKQCVKDSARTAFPTFHSVDGDSDSDVDPREMLIIVEEKFQESLQVNKKKCLENDSLKRELSKSKRDVEQLIKELQRYKGKVTAEDDTEDDTDDDTEVDTAKELAILQKKWVELVQANQKTVLENQQLVAKRNRLKESISELEKKIEDLEGKQSDPKYELNKLKNFHKWMRSAGAKAIEEQVNVSKFYGDKTGLGFSGSESNKTPLDLFVDRRKEIAQKVSQGRKTEAAASAGTSSAKPAEACNEASAGTIYAAPYAKRQRVVTQSSMRRHKDHYAKPERYSYTNVYANYVCFCCGKRGHIQRKCKIFKEQRHRKKNVTTKMIWVPKIQYKKGDNPCVNDVASDQCHVSSASLHQEEKKIDRCAVNNAESSHKCDEVTPPTHESVKFMAMKKRALGMCKRAFDGNRSNPIDIQNQTDIALDEYKKKLKEIEIDEFANTPKYLEE